MKLVPIGIENFKELIDRNYYYVDKTMLIKDIISQKVCLFTRPRRFGKTLNMSMLYYFFSIRERDNQYLFDHLNISEDRDIMQHQNQYPVIYITLKEMKNNTFEKQISMFSFLIQEIIRTNSELLESERLTDIERHQLKKYIYGTKDEVELQNALKFISQCLYQHYHQKVIILIDEYDVPLQDAYLHGYYEDMTGFLRNVFSSALKTNDALEKGIMTGCLRIAKESIFTGLNNFSVYSILNKGLTSRYFGFTQEETDEALSYYHLNEYREKMKEWYDGYLFGDIEIYNPWSTLKYIDQIIREDDSQPQSYWANTSSNDIIYKYILESNDMMHEEFEKLVNRETIEKEILPELTYREMDDINNIYSFLLLTGYLRIEKQINYNRYQLVIPNKEVLQIFENTFMKYYKEFTNDKTKIMIHLLKEGQTDQAESLLIQMLEKSISYYDNKEDFYHGFMIGLLQGYDVKSNRESGEGRFDIAVFPKNIRDVCLIIECKHAHSIAELQHKSEEAAQQIEKKKYYEGFKEAGYRNCIGYGIAFYKKTCYITKL